MKKKKIIYALHGKVVSYSPPLSELGFRYVVIERDDDLHKVSLRVPLRFDPLYVNNQRLRDGALIPYSQRPEVRLLYAIATLEEDRMAVQFD